MRSPAASRIRRLWALLAAVSLLGAGFLLGVPATTIPGRGAPVPDRVSGPAEAIDGDTLRMSLATGEERVRLIGINAPERGECLADEARLLLQELVAEGPLRLEEDVSDRDRYGRLLRYVHAGPTFVNLAMVSAGRAVAARHPPDVGRSDELTRAEADARAGDRGIWHRGACHGSSTGVALGEIRFDGPAQGSNAEYADVVNRGSGWVDLGGWELRDATAGHRFSFPDGFGLAAGEVVRVHSSCGDGTPTDLYWCGGPVWNDDGDTAFLIDAQGGIADHRSG